MKLLTYQGPEGHLFEVPGFFTIASGESHEISDHMAEAVLNANPNEPLIVTDLPKTPKRSAASQPEAHEGEGHATAPDPQEE